MHIYVCTCIVYIFYIMMFDILRTFMVEERLPLLGLVSFTNDKGLRQEHAFDLQINHPRTRLSQFGPYTQGSNMPLL